MNRTAIRVFNWSLLGLACLEVAMMIVALVTATLPAEPAVASLPSNPTERGPRTWNDRKVILERNLFNVAVLTPTVVREPEENLEDTKLPLKLLGTVASNPALSWAAVQDMQAGDHVVVRLGQELQGRAEVTRIERRCIVLQNGPRLEKLCLAEDDGPAPKQRTASRARPRASARAGRSRVQERLERLAEQRIALPRDAVEKAARNPASIFSQARILPKYEDGSMVGVQVNSIKPGSMLEDIGLENGDTISEFNGIQISSPEDSTEVLREIGQASEFTVVVQGADGRERTLTYELED